MSPVSPTILSVAYTRRMDQDVNPLLPAAYDITWSLVALVPLVLTVIAAVLILMSPRYTVGGKALWVVAVFALPFLGAIAWFLTGRTARLRTDAP